MSVLDIFPDLDHELYIFNSTYLLKNTRKVDFAFEFNICFFLLFYISSLAHQV